MFYNLFGCMHACILHVLSVCLTRVVTIQQSLKNITYAANDFILKSVLVIRSCQKITRIEKVKQNWTDLAENEFSKQSVSLVGVSDEVKVGKVLITETLR